MTKCHKTHLEKWVSTYAEPKETAAKQNENYTTNGRPAALGDSLSFQGVRGARLLQMDQEDPVVQAGGTWITSVHPITKSLLP